MPTRSLGLAKATLAFAVLRMLLSIVLAVVNIALVPRLYRSFGMNGMKMVFGVQQTLTGLVALGAVICFMLFLRAEIISLRASGIRTSTSPGMAIGWWFIPFANFVMPAVVASEVWKLRMRSAPALPVVWWVLYLASAAYPLLQMQMHMRTLLPYLGLLLVFGAFGSWAAMVSMLMKAPVAAPYAPQPGAYYAPQYPPRM